MDNSRSEGSLLDEIHFLTSEFPPSFHPSSCYNCLDLISSHQSTGGAGPPSLRERSRQVGMYLSCMQKLGRIFASVNSWLVIIEDGHPSLPVQLSK